MTESRFAIATATFLALLACLHLLAGGATEDRAGRSRGSVAGRAFALSEQTGKSGQVSILPGRVEPGMQVEAEVRGLPNEGLRYAWRVGNGPFVEGAARFQVPEGAGRTQLSVRVEARGEGRAHAAGPLVASVVVGNRPPVLGDAELVPAGMLRVGETLRVAAGAEDPDGDRVRIEYTWLVNGRPLRHRYSSLPADRLAVGDQVEVEVWASDGVERSRVVRLGPVERLNSLPEITSRPPAQLAAGAFEYRLRARDPDDSRRLRFRLLEGPTGTSLDPLSGRLTWDPSRAEPGRHEVLVSVEDWIGGRATQRFEVGVDPPLTGLPVASAH